MVTLLAFVNSRNALLDEITHSLGLTASAVSLDINRQLFERLLNATTWNHLEVMEDIRLGDVDKRLSRFLSETKLHHGGVYLDLHAIDVDGRIVASSAPASIGASPQLSTPWLVADLNNERVDVFGPGAADGAPRFTLRSAITSQFSNEAVGFLVLEVDWLQIEKVLDQSSTPTRQILILDHEGRIAAASWNLRSKGIVHGAAGNEWRPAVAAELIEERNHTSAFDGPTIIGYEKSRGTDHFSGFDWTFVLLQSRAEALAPIERMAWGFAGILALMSVGVIMVSLWVAGAISRPVIALTDFTRRFLQPGPAPEPPLAGPGEVGELTRSFTRMVGDLQQSQRTLTQASKLAAVGEVTALLAHEVRTPLGILRSSAQMLRLDASIGAENHELMQIIITESERLNRLVGSMLDSTRTRPPDFAATDIHGLIAHTCTLLAAQARDRGIVIDVNARAADFVIDCDPEQMTQVFLNIMMNALQILASGGRIEVTTRDEPNRLIVEIADDGPGIPEDQRSQIFDPFVFKREGGLGLGLAVVRTIVRSHGGDIAAASSDLGGALFRITLPRSKPSRALE